MRRRGVSLAQLALALGVLAVLLATVGPLATGRLESAQAARTVREARGIADAALAYWGRTQVWPADVPVLVAAGDLPPGASAVNPFGLPYTLSPGARSMTVVTTVPVAALPEAGGDLLTRTVSGGATEVRVTRVVAEAGLSGAVFDKRHLYLE